MDDDNITNFVNARIIKKLSLSEEVKIANNGKEALEFLKSVDSMTGNGPNLILLDMNMPVMDGLEFLDIYQKRPSGKSKPVVLMLSTTNNNSDILKMKRYPILDGFIQKPLTEEKILDVFLKYFA